MGRSEELGDLKKTGHEISSMLDIPESGVSGISGKWSTTAKVHGV